MKKAIVAYFKIISIFSDMDTSLTVAGFRDRIRN